MPDTGPTFDSGLDDPIDPPRRRRGAPKGNLNAFKYGGHSRTAGIPYDIIPFTPLRDLLRLAVMVATREEIAALPARPTSAERREANRRGVRRVIDCLRTIDLTVPRNYGRMTFAFLHALQPILGPEYDRRMAHELEKNKEQFTAPAAGATGPAAEVEDDGHDDLLPPLYPDRVDEDRYDPDAEDDLAGIGWSPERAPRKFYRHPNRRGHNRPEGLLPGLP